MSPIGMTERDDECVTDKCVTKRRQRCYLKVSQKWMTKVPLINMTERRDESVTDKMTKVSPISMTRYLEGVTDRYDIIDDEGSIDTYDTKR